MARPGPNDRPSRLVGIISRPLRNRCADRSSARNTGSPPKLNVNPHSSSNDRTFSRRRWSLVRRHTQCESPPGSHGQTRVAWPSPGGMAKPGASMLREPHKQIAGRRHVRTTATCSESTWRRRPLCESAIRVVVGPAWPCHPVPKLEQSVAGQRQTNRSRKQHGRGIGGLVMVARCHILR